MRFNFSYTALRVRDLNTSVNLYTRVMGLEVVARTEVPETRGKLAVLRSRPGGPLLELNWYDEGSPVAGPYRKGEELDHIAFRVDDLHRALEDLAAKGRRVVHGPITTKAASWAYINDPDGIRVEIYEKRES